MAEKPLHPLGENIDYSKSWLAVPPNTVTRTEAEPHTAPDASGPPIDWDAPVEYVVSAEPEVAKQGPLYHALAYAPVTLTPNGSSGDSKLEAAVADQMLALFKLFKERQKKYGPGNIAAFGDYGVLVRCHDKMARLRQHYELGTGDMPDESVNDAWADLAVYAMIALVCRHGQWPGWEPKGGK